MACLAVCCFLAFFLCFKKGKFFIVGGIPIKLVARMEGPGVVAALSHSHASRIPIPAWNLSKILQSDAGTGQECSFRTRS